VTLLDHPELGETDTAADGWFDLAVNGGGTLTVVYEAEGYLTAEREALGVLGGKVVPREPIPEDALFWNMENSIRVLESRRGRASAVIANCFAFRRGLVETYPEDVIADDAFMAWTAHSKKLQVLYVPELLVYELRSPSNFWEFFRHKLRKGNAVMRELLRFMPARSGSGVWNVVYFTKFLQTFVFPFLLVLFLVLSILLAGMSTLFVVSFWVLLTASHVAASRILNAGRGSEKKPSFLASLRFPVIVTAILFANLFLYPFFRQTSRYKKVR